MHEEIQQYLEKQLSPEAQAAFEQRLKEEPDLLRSLEAELAARASIALTGRDQRKANLKARYKRRKAPVNIINMRSASLIAVAAAALFLIIWLPGQVGSNELNGPDLYTSYFETEVLSGVRSSDNASYQEWRLAADYYNAERYLEAIPLFEALTRDTTFEEVSKVQFFLAMSYLETGKPEEAITHFEAVAAGSAFEARARWFRALAYLKQNRQEDAKLLLEIIRNYSDHFKKTEAEALLKKL